MSCNVIEVLPYTYFILYIKERARKGFVLIDRPRAFLWDKKKWRGTFGSAPREFNIQRVCLLIELVTVVRYLGLACQRGHQQVEATHIDR